MKSTVDNAIEEYYRKCHRYPKEIKMTYDNYNKLCIELDLDIVNNKARAFNEYKGVKIIIEDLI